MKIEGRRLNAFERCAVIADLRRQRAAYRQLHARATARAKFFSGRAHAAETEHARLLAEEAFGFMAPAAVGAPPSYFVAYPVREEEEPCRT